MRTIAIFLAVTGVVASSGRATADPAPMSSGASPAPVDDAQVAMLTEDLAISMGVATADVVADMMLENQGPATALVVGFPCATGDDAGLIDVPCRTKITVKVDGKKTRVTRRKGDTADTSHWTWKLKLADHQKVRLVVSYRAPLINDRYTAPAKGIGMFSYRLTTGARWAGPIGKLTIKLDHMNDALLFISPPGFQRTPGQITWSLDNYEPTAEVLYMPVPGPHQLLGKTAAEVGKRLAQGDFKKRAIDDEIDQLQRYAGPDPQGHDYLDDWLEIISSLGKLPRPALADARAITAGSIDLLKELATKAKP